MTKPSIAPAHKAWDQFDLRAGHTIGKIRAPLLHHAFTGVEQFTKKVNANSSVRARELKLRSPLMLGLRILFGLPLYTAKRLFINQYFRGGIYGFALALISGYGRWLRDVKMWERWQNERRSIVGKIIFDQIKIT